MSTGLNLLSKILSAADTEGFVRMGLLPELFYLDEREVFEFIQDHVAKFGTLPKRATLERETGIQLPEAAEPADYYLQDLERRHLHHELVKGLERARDHLKDGQPETALETVRETAMRLTTGGCRREIFDFRKACDPIMAEFKRRISQGADYGIRLGWETFDNMTGGLREADTMAIVGRPALGKTYLITWAARNVWWKHHKVPLLLSMEMDGVALMQRALGIQSSVNTKQIRDAALTTANLKRMKGALQAVSEHDVPFWIVDGNQAATVDELVLLARQLKPDVVFIDGGYLMGHPKENISLWQKVQENVEALHKNISKGMGIPTVVSYQFSREVTKLKKGQEAGVEHIGLSDAIGQVCSHVLGLFEEETVETLQRRRVTILKGREGAVGSFTLAWNFRAMDFSELPPDKKVENIGYV